MTKDKCKGKYKKDYDLPGVEPVLEPKPPNVDDWVFDWPKPPLPKPLPKDMTGSSRQVGR